MKAPERLTMRRKAISCPKIPTERDESMALVKWAKTMVDTGQEPRLKLLRCGFEGLRLGMGLRMQVKRQSVSVGFPDFTLYVACHGYHGCLIELKRLKGGKVSAEQLWLHNELRMQGYFVDVFKGADAAIRFLKSYLDIL